MFYTEVTLHKDLLGRVAANFVNDTQNIECGVYIQNDSYCVNAKSLLGILTLHATQGCKITLLSEKEQSLVQLCKLITEI